MALVEGEYGLTVGTEEHKVGFPMAWGSTILGRVTTFREGASKANERSGTGGFRLPVAAFGLGLGDRSGHSGIALSGDIANPGGSPATSPFRSATPLNSRDPDLQRFAGARIRRHVVGQFHTVLQWRSVCIGIPWQHLNKVLHFVCELRESRGRGCGHPRAIGPRKIMQSINRETCPQRKMYRWGLSPG